MIFMAKVSVFRCVGHYVARGVMLWLTQWHGGVGDCPADWNVGSFVLVGVCGEMHLGPRPAIFRVLWQFLVTRKSRPIQLKRSLLRHRGHYNGYPFDDVIGRPLWEF